MTSSRHNRFLSGWKLFICWGMLLAQEFATGQSGIGYTLLDWKRVVSTLAFRWRCDAVKPDANGPGFIRAGLAGNGATFCFRMNPGLDRISPIEHLGRQVRERNDVNNIRDLERALQAEWVRIPLQVIRKLNCSIIHRCLAVLAGNGRHTRYWAMSEFLHLTP